MSGVKNIRSGIDSMSRLKSAIRDLPVRIRSSVAKDTSGYLDIEVRAVFAAGQTVFDTPRPLGTSGNTLTLVDPRPSPKTSRQWKKRKGTWPHTGQHVRDSLGFTSNGTVVRAVLGQKYAKYLVGKYRILPMLLPSAWQAQIERIVDEYRDDWNRENGLAVSR